MNPQKQILGFLSIFHYSLLHKKSIGKMSRYNIFSSRYQYNILKCIADTDTNTIIVLDYLYRRYKYCRYTPSANY